jgi:hypothetical protein
MDASHMSLEEGYSSTRQPHALMFQHETCGGTSPRHLSSLSFASETSAIVGLIDRQQSPFLVSYDCPPGSAVFFTENICHAGPIWKRDDPRVTILHAYVQYRDMQCNQNAWAQHSTFSVENAKMMRKMPPRSGFLN